MLDYSELRKDLISDLHFRMAIDADIEATFSVNKANNPVRRDFHIQSSRNASVMDTQRKVSEDLHQRRISCGLSNLHHSYCPVRGLNE